MFEILIYRCSYQLSQNKQKESNQRFLFTGNGNLDFSIKRDTNSNNKKEKKKQESSRKDETETGELLQAPKAKTV